MTGDSLIHGVVDNFGRQVVQSGLVGAADVHAGAPTDGLQAFEDLDILRRIPGIPFLGAFAAIIKQIVHRHGHPVRLRCDFTGGRGGTLYSMIFLGNNDI
jgi:hypothetical protein